jgi:hypothetical protein
MELHRALQCVHEVPDSDDDADVAEWKVCPPFLINFTTIMALVGDDVLWLILIQFYSLFPHILYVHGHT